MADIFPAPEIFKAYDIRGVVETVLTPATVKAIGQALGSEAQARGQKKIVVGRDGRLSGPALAAALAEGICEAGVDVIDIGCVPTPVTYFAAHHLGVFSCVSVTGSHNPPAYNGLKMVLAGQTLYGDMIQGLRQRIIDNHFTTGNGTVSQYDIIPAYLERITSDIRLTRPIKIVVDCGNGVAGAIAPILFKQLGCEVRPLFCEVDGHFPNHHPDPSKPENLQDLIHALKTTDAELGIAFDGDGDRLGVVTKAGEIIYPDRQIMLFAADILSRVPGGEILFDVKCTRKLSEWVEQHGGKATMWKTGHALMKAKLQETQAPFAGEMSGHFFFKERWYGFDDGLYAGARLLEILSRAQNANALLETLPNSVSTPELNIAMQEGQPAQLVQKLMQCARFPQEKARITLDGLRVEFDDGFGLVRPSNTTPVVVLRFEADTHAALTRIQKDFQAQLDAVWPGLVIGSAH